MGGAAEEDRVEMMQQWRSVYESGPWKFDTPVEHLTKYTPSSGSKEGMRGGIKLHARIVRTIEAMHATRVWSEAEGNQHLQEVMLASGGPGTGKLWTAIP